MNTKYIIKDKENRSFGSFEVLGSNDDSVYGYLEPTSIFSEIQHIFDEHEKELSIPNSTGDDTIKNILNLGTYLIDSKTGKKIDTRGIIFINKDLLVTCNISK